MYPFRKKYVRYVEEKMLCGEVKGKKNNGDDQLENISCTRNIIFVSQSISCGAIANQALGDKRLAGQESLHCMAPPPGCAEA